MTDTELEKMKRELWFSFFIEHLFKTNHITQEQRDRLERLIG